MPIAPSTTNEPPKSESPADETTAQIPAQVLPPVLASAEKKDGSDFDPIKENGPIFVGWEKPDLALVISGRMDGYIEPCGCAGLDRMSGGMSRRATMIDQLRNDGWPVLALDVGSLIKGYGRQAEIKFQMVVESFRKMGYDAIGLGKTDLQLPAGELASVTAGEESPFVSANVGLFDLDSELIARSKILEAGGIKVGVTSIFGESFQKQINNQDIVSLNPAAALQKVLPKFENESLCLQILLAFSTKEEAIKLAKQFPQFDIIVMGDGPAEPPSKPEKVPGTDQLLIEVGDKGTNAIVLGYYAGNPEPKITYQRVPLDSRFPASTTMGHLMAAYQEQLKMQGLEGLHIRPVQFEDAPLKGEFIGSKKCETCHEESYEVWKKSSHADAWQSLLDSPIPRNHDPECISCHVVGWHPTRYFPYKSGFLSVEKTDHLKNVGCESCHGPGEAHAKAEVGADEPLQEKLRTAMRVTVEEAQNDPRKMCYNCHDLDNSPDFNFETYWPKVAHKENEDDEEAEDESQPSQ